MDSKYSAVLVTILFSLVGVLGDIFLKIASRQVSPVKTWSFAVGFWLYASTAFGWLYVMKYLKLGTISVLYSVSMIVMLTLSGVLFFRETLSTPEVMGIAMAIGSLILLTRFG